MKASCIIAGQKVNSVKKELSRRLRHQMTPAEAVLWEELRDRRFCGLKFRRQQVIAGFIVDFYCHQVGLAIEIDGDVHSLQEEYDKERDEVLNARGIRVLRIKNEDLNNLTPVLERVKSACTLPRKDEVNDKSPR